MIESLLPPWLNRSCRRDRIAPAAVIETRALSFAADGRDRISRTAVGSDRSRRHERLYQGGTRDSITTAGETISRMQERWSAQLKIGSRMCIQSHTPSLQSTKKSLIFSQNPLAKTENHEISRIFSKMLFFLRAIRKNHENSLFFIKSRYEKVRTHSVPASK